MNEFVEECRREWKRLGVAAPVANEMAADLEADLREAASEGVSAEEVLGTGAFDPRSFAAAWAAERGVVARPQAASAGPRIATGLLRRWGVLAVVAASALVACIGAALALRRSASSEAFGSPFAAPVPQWRFPVPAGFATPMQLDGGHAAELGMILIVVGVLGFVFATLAWSPWAARGRSMRSGRSHVC